jgi:hypothetical protein
MEKKNTTKFSVEVLKLSTYSLSSFIYHCAIVLRNRKFKEEVYISRIGQLLYGSVFAAFLTNYALDSSFVYVYILGKSCHQLVSSLTFFAGSAEGGEA